MIQIPKLFNPESNEIPKTVYPLLPLRDIVVFPHMVAPLFVGRKKSVNALTDAMNKDKTVFLATQTRAGIDNPKEGDISHMGTIGTILQLLKLPDGTVKALVEGKSRARISEFLENDDFFRVAVESVTEGRKVHRAADPSCLSIEHLMGNVNTDQLPERFCDHLCYDKHEGERDDQKPRHETCRRTRCCSSRGRELLVCQRRMCPPRHSHRREDRRCSGELLC